MPSQTLATPAVPMSGDLASPATFEPNQWAGLINFEHTRAGTIRKRRGFEQLNATGMTTTVGFNARLRAVGEFWLTNVVSGAIARTRRWVACGIDSANRSALFSSSNGTSWSQLLYPWGSTGNRFPLLTIADGYAVMANGAATPQKWDQTTLSDLGASAPVAGGFTYHLRRLFSFAEAAGDGSTVKYCAASDITDWTGTDTGSFVLDENDGDYALGASQPLLGRIYFFKGPHLGSIHELSGQTPSTFVLTRISTGAPCLDKASVVTTGTNVFWGSYDGVHSLKQLLQTGHSLISGKIQRTFEQFLPKESGEGQGRLGSGVHNAAENYVAWGGQWYNNGAARNAILVYYYLLDKWAVWETTHTNNGLGMTGATPNIYISPDVGADVSRTGSLYDVSPQLLVGGTGFVFSMHRNDDASRNDETSNGVYASFVAYATTPVYYSFPGIGPEAHKQLYAVGVLGRAGTANATITAMVRQESDTTGTNATITLPTDVKQKLTLYGEAPVEGVSRWVEVTFSETSANRLEIDGTYLRVAPADNFAQVASGG